jgi:hypothetical protein
MQTQARAALGHTYGLRKETGYFPLILLLTSNVNDICFAHLQFKVKVDSWVSTGQIASHKELYC